MQVAKTETRKTVDLRERVEVRRVADGTIRSVGKLVAEKGIKEGYYEDPKAPAKGKKEKPE
jgi:hypothetical protein